MDAPRKSRGKRADSAGTTFSGIPIRRLHKVKRGKDLVGNQRARKMEEVSQAKDDKIAQTLYRSLTQQFLSSNVGGEQNNSRKVTS